jgi:transglutaminase-like putative cysteine protease
MVTRATGDPRLREHLARVMDEFNVPPRNPEMLARAIQAWMQQNIRYLREAPETLVHPRRTLDWRVGDCDDMTILTCAALRGAKIPCRAVFVGWSPQGSLGTIPLRHVFPEAFVGGQWRSLESVRPVPFGWDASAFRSTQGMRVRRTSIGDDEKREPMGLPNETGTVLE